MKIEIAGVPTFRVAFDAVLTEALSICSRLHYDVKCKKAGELGGFLYGIKIGTEFAYECGEPTYSRALTFDEADSLLKISEFTSFTFTTEQRLKIYEFRASLIRAIKVANDACQGWRIEVEF